MIHYRKIIIKIKDIMVKHFIGAVMKDWRILFEDEYFYDQIDYNSIIKDVTISTSFLSIKPFNINKPPRLYGEASEKISKKLKIQSMDSIFEKFQSEKIYGKLFQIETNLLHINHTGKLLLNLATQLLNQKEIPTIDVTYLHNFIKTDLPIVMGEKQDSDKVRSEFLTWIKSKFGEDILRITGNHASQRDRDIWLTKTFHNREWLCCMVGTEVDRPFNCYIPINSRNDIPGFGFEAKIICEPFFDPNPVGQQIPYSIKVYSVFAKTITQQV
jgi:hypothetical protein